MTCQVEQIADCGDISTLGRALFIPEREDTTWLSRCSISLSSCGNLLAVGYNERLCLLTTHWISSTDSNTYLISWSGTLQHQITALLALPICSFQQSSQNGPDWFCIIVGFKNGCVGFYTNTGHLLLLEKLDEKAVVKISCHTGPYGTLPDDLHILFQNCECIISGSNLFQTLRNAKSQLARVQGGVQEDYSVDSRNINIRKWHFSEQDVINDAAVVGLELKNTYDHLLAASTYGGYDSWYRSVPPVNTLILGAGVKPYLGFHYALEGGTAPPIQDVARAVANKIKSALPGWLGGGSTDNTSANTEPRIQSEQLSMRSGIYDRPRHGTSIAVSPDRRLAAIADNVGRVAVLDIKRGYIIRLFKGYRDAQCAFIQVFQQDEKKAQLSVVKDIKKAIFLIIYNPKKGLIDIRLMQNGNRVAVFTATKNGKLIYNTCGLVGAEKSYNHKKLNVPEFQCVLIDPDGKLKKFIIPFFYALDGEHSDRAKDLHILRELRDYIKKNIVIEDNLIEINKRISEIKTVDLKKYCLEIMIRNYGFAPNVVMSSLETLWDSLVDLQLNTEEQRIKTYFLNVGLITLFFSRLNNEPTEDMKELITKMCDGDKIKTESIDSDDLIKEVQEPIADVTTFNLLEDDTCILERLLILAQENNYRENIHTKVKFVENKTNMYKDFLSCFILDGNSKYIHLKPNIPLEVMSSLASDIFKSIFKISDIKSLGNFVKESKIDPKEMMKLMIMHLMNIYLNDISIDVIEKLITIFYYICCAEDKAVNISYNEISPWWQNIRDILIEMSCPLKSMIVAMACKAVSRIFENRPSDEVAWESVTKENAKWGILIGKLEDISILSIILMHKGEFKGKSLPKLQVNEFDVNLKYIYTRGKGSVTELIAKWLCGMGVIPEAIIANELMETNVNYNNESVEVDDEGSETQLFIENNRIYVDENPVIFKWLSLLRQQFPLSTLSDYIIANMSWEYAIEWQKDMKKTENLNAVIQCLSCIGNIYLQLGLFSIIWSTYIKQTFEASCRLINKVGKLPKESLCLQDVGLNNACMLHFLEIATKYLERFLDSSMLPITIDKPKIQYEKIWDQSTPSLAEVAQDAYKINSDFLNLNYQVSCVIYYQSHFNLKFPKPLDNLYDIDYQHVFDGLSSNSVHRNINMRASEKVRSPRMKFVTKLIRASVETITYNDREGPIKIYNSEECVLWMKNISSLAEQWNIEDDFLRRQQVVSLYHVGYDALAEDLISTINDPEALLPPLLAITMQRLKRSLEYSSNQPEWIVTVAPNLYKRLQNTVLDPSIPAHPSLTTTISTLQKVLCLIEKKSAESYSRSQDVKLAELAIDSCEILSRRNL